MNSTQKLINETREELINWASDRSGSNYFVQQFERCDVKICIACLRPIMEYCVFVYTPEKRHYLISTLEMEQAIDQLNNSFLYYEKLNP